MSILSVQPINHIFTDYPYARTDTFSSRSSSPRTVHHHGQWRTFSGSSSASAATADHTSMKSQAAQENVGPLRTVQSTLTYTRAQRPTLRKVVSQLPPRTLWSADTTSPYQELERPSTPDSLATLANDNLEDRVRASSLFSGFDSIAELDAVETAVPQKPVEVSVGDDKETAAVDQAPFKKWLGTLRQRREPQALTELTYRIPIDGEDYNDFSHPSGPQSSDNARPRASTVESSTHGFVTAVKSATVTLAESSIAPKSWLGNLSKQLHRGRHSRSNTVDSTGTRSSMDQGVDEFAMSRARQRRLILEELIETEESYVADLRVLQNVYTTLLPCSSLPSHMRTSVRENLMQLIQLHDTVLDNLYDIVPNSEYNHKHAKETPSFHTKGHVRWKSADGSPSTAAIAGRLMDSKLGRRLRHSVDISRPPAKTGIATASDPKVAAAVGRLFSKHMKEFFAYEEYAGKYESMAQQLASTYREMFTKGLIERGIENLARTLQPSDGRADDVKKGLTFQDLLIKPIQRICKYPLLFNDLLKHTPIGDDPISHAELELLLGRLRILATDVNKASHDQRTKDLIEKTWLLQDRLNFGDQQESLVLIRHLGHVNLCGVLHVAYQSRRDVKGQYMLCALFRSCLIIAVPEKSSPGYTVVACVPLCTAQLEDADNGRGLQCHTAPYSWKLVFGMDRRMHEILFSACSPAEETRWRQSLCQLPVMTGLRDAASIHRNLSSELARDIKPLMGNYTHKASLSTRMSIRRAATLGPSSQLSQVVIRNTASSDQIAPSASTSSLQIGRSQSLNTPAHIPILCPRRSERIQLEIAMTDLYTKDSLPFPGMKSNENSFRASAHSVMRKLSMASISSTFSRRSVSLASLHSSRSKQQSAPSGHDTIGRSQRGRTPSTLRPVENIRPIPLLSGSVAAPVSPFNPAVPVVDFHKTPDAFLPLDFALRDPRVPTLPRNSTLRAVASKQVLAVNPDVPDYHRLKRSTSMQGDTLPTDGRDLLALRPNLISTKSEGIRRRSLDATRALDNIGFSQAPGKENTAVVGTDRPVLRSTKSSFAVSKPLSQRLRDLIR